MPDKTIYKIYLSIKYMYLKNLQKSHVIKCLKQIFSIWAKTQDKEKVKI